LNNLRIIALINMSNKIYVKVLQRYLQPIFVNIMNMNQLTFLLLKYILDDIVLIHEMLDCTRKLEQSLAFLELDYSKVFLKIFLVSFFNVYISWDSLMLSFI